MEKINLIHEFPYRYLRKIEELDNLTIEEMDSLTIEDLDYSQREYWLPNTKVNLVHGEIEHVRLVHDISIGTPRLLKEIRTMTLNELRKMSMEEVRYKRV